MIEKSNLFGQPGQISQQAALNQQLLNQSKMNEQGGDKGLREKQNATTTTSKGNRAMVGGKAKTSQVNSFKFYQQ